MHTDEKQCWLHFLKNKQHAMIPPQVFLAIYIYISICCYFLNQFLTNFKPILLFLEHKINKW